MKTAMKLNPSPEDPEELADLADLCGVEESEMKEMADEGYYLIMDDPESENREWMAVTTEIFDRDFKFVGEEIDDFVEVVAK